MRNRRERLPHPVELVSVAEVLDRLEMHYGTQAPCWPTDPYRFLVWWHCGYPPSDAACSRGWASLTERVGIEPAQLLAAGSAGLTAALEAGGMVPALRATRLREIASRVLDEFGGNLRAALAGRLGEAPRLLKQFPGIAGPGADRILLFAGLAPVAAVPSNTPHVLVRIRQGRERETYAANYLAAQQIIGGAVVADVRSRSRAYLLLKQHGQAICKRTKPACGECPVNSVCAFFLGERDGKPVRFPVE
jgi:endonuclease III